MNVYVKNDSLGLIDPIHPETSGVGKTPKSTLSLHLLSKGSRLSRRRDSAQHDRSRRDRPASTASLRLGMFHVERSEDLDPHLFVWRTVEGNTYPEEA